MKKHLLFVVLVMALVLSFSWGVCANEYGTVTASAVDDPNQYDVSSGISTGYAADDLWIGTLDAWKAAGGAVQGTGTFFDNGEAINGDDIVMTNGVCGIVLAVGTRNPWGYPAGSVLDAGTVDYTSGALTTATGNRDMTWSIEPLVKGWDSWAPDNCGVVEFSLVHYDFDTKQEVASGGLVAVKVFRIYDVGGVKFNVNTYYAIGADQSFAYMYNSYENTTGSAVSVNNRLAVTNKGDDGGAMFGIGHSIGSYAMTGGIEYFCGVYYGGDQFSKIGGSVGYKELRTASSYAAGETKVVDTYIVLSDTADFEALNDLINDVQDVAAFTTVSGTTVANGTVVVKKDGTTIGWYKADAQGNFSFQVPQDESTYTMYLEAKGYADGAAVEIDNSGATDEVGNLAAGAAKVNMTMTVKDTEGNPIFAKIEVFESHDGGNTYVSAYPTIRFNGDSIYYTDADANGDSTGVIHFEVEAGYYKVVVYGEGYWFYCEPMEMTGNTADSTTLYPEINEEYSAPEGWLCGDTHHHGNKNDAFSSPADVIKSLAASGLDVGFMTDHDFTTNNEEMYELSADYGLTGYVPSEEISCSWAHFNVLPTTSDGYNNFLDVDQENNVMNQFAQLPVFVKQAHDTGAAITANHPWYSYGLFYADSVDAIPGGYTDDYDNIEINASCADSENLEVLLSTTDLWTSYQDGTALYQDVNGDDVVTEKAHYLVAGSDTHDVRYPGFSSSSNTNNRGSGWYASGKVRTYAYVGTDVTENTKGDYIKDNGIAFSEAAVEGNSYITYGPVLDIDKIPGETYNVYQNSEFNAYVEVSSLADLQGIYVLTKTGTQDLTAMGTSMYSHEYMKYDYEATTYDTHYTYDSTKGVYEVYVGVDVDEEDTWAALLVLDTNGNYAVTNPWWINANRFSDVPETTWYTDAVAMGYNLGIVNGYGDGTFQPLKQVTRAEFAKMCYGLLNQNFEYFHIDAVGSDPSFSDVKSGAWYYDAVMYMAECGYINGYPDGTFKPNSYITRAEIAQIVYNVVMDIAKDDIYAYRHMYFADVPKGAWYYEAVMTLADAGLVNGYPVPELSSDKEHDDYYFLPQTTATRAESLQFIANMVMYEYNPMP